MEFGLSCTASSLAGLPPARELVADLVSNLSQTSSSSRHVEIARELVCEVLASRIVRDRPNFITLSSSLAGRRPAREPACVLVC